MTKSLSFHCQAAFRQHLLITLKERGSESIPDILIPCVSPILKKSPMLYSSYMKRLVNVIKIWILAVNWLNGYFSYFTCKYEIKQKYLSYKKYKERLDIYLVLNRHNNKFKYLSCISYTQVKIPQKDQKMLQITTL